MPHEFTLTNGNLQFSSPSLQNPSLGIIIDIDNQQEFILYPEKSLIGKSLKREVERLGMRSVFGPKILQIMRKLGYLVNDLPLNNVEHQKHGIPQPTNDSIQTLFPTKTNLVNDFASIKSPFNFKVNCTHVSDYDCQNSKYLILTRLVLLKAGKRINRELELKESIEVQVIFGPISNVQCLNTTKNCDPVPSMSYANHLLARKNDGPTLNYPTSVLKQYIQLPPSDMDFFIEFNSDINWDYSGIALNSHRMYDFECNFC